MDEEKKKNRSDNQQNSEGEIEILNKKIAELEAVVEDYLSGWKRAKADFINYKKDEEKHAANVLKFIKINFLKKFLPILDSLEEAKKQKNAEIDVLGLQIAQIFKSEGLEEIEALGKAFDPNFHESIGVVESDDEENMVTEELRKGYVVEGEVVRPALIKVSVHSAN